MSEILDDVIKTKIYEVLGKVNECIMDYNFDNSEFVKREESKRKKTPRKFMDEILKPTYGEEHKYSMCLIKDLLSSVCAPFIISNL